MEPLDLLSRARSLHWVVASAVILLIDYATGPYVQFPILLIVPVAIATIANGLPVGVTVATVLPLIRLGFYLSWEPQSTWVLQWTDTLVDVAILGAFSALIARIIRQQRQIKLLEGMLPICSFCKRIREPGGAWQKLEIFIGERSDARFSHTLCDDCGREHYSGFVD